jgi:hypothetical protein
MLRRAPLLLAAGLFLVGVAGLLATTTSSDHTTPFVASPPRDASLPAPATHPAPIPPELPLGPIDPPLAASTGSAHDAPSAALAFETTPSPAPEPREPVVAAAVAADSTHELTLTPTPSPTAGVTLRTVMIGRDDSTAVTPAAGP